MNHSFANLPLHGGKAPAWLFQRMKKLAGSLVEVMAMELGPDGFLASTPCVAWQNSWRFDRGADLAAGAKKSGRPGKNGRPHGCIALADQLLGEVTLA